MTLETLCPDKIVDREWDVRRESHIDKLVDEYSSEWMPPCQKINYIYVPFEELNGAWFLMVISLEQGVIYYFDSYGLPQIQPAKTSIMKQVCLVISQMFQGFPYLAAIYSAYYEMELWEIIQPQGLPRYSQGDISAIWVLTWMSMVDAFTANISPKMSEKNVRMHLALDLVQGNHNQYWEEIRGKSEAFWQRIRERN
ncbi:Ulp1 protease family, C-terminal catalytic domain [Sesbania bispinosa]|nr:Ulp1 protease family, C-terminal catalytic domain [Sesbania bispinosa]